MAGRKPGQRFGVAGDVLSGPEYAAAFSRHLGVPVADRTGSLGQVWLQFFLGLVFPYLLVVSMAYVGARVIYHLGTEVSRAREGRVRECRVVRRGDCPAADDEAQEQA